VRWKKTRRRGRRRWLPRLRPLPGRRLPKKLRAENVGRLAAALPRGLRDPDFEPLLTRIETSPVLPGNRLTVYTDGTDAFESMLAAIDAAAQEVLLEAYIFRDDATGQAFRDALGHAAERGAAVRVLADGFGSSETGEVFWDSLRAQGADVRIFHPLLSRFWNFAFRDHRKILVVDRRISFTGGMNIGVEYGSSRRSARQAKEHHAWRDTQVRVAGPTAWEMAIVFGEGWIRSGGTPIDLPPLIAAEAPGARILTLGTRPGRGTDELASILTAIVAAARKRVWITNAYFAPKERAIELLAAAVRRGVDVRLLLPGVSDVPVMQRAGRGYYTALLAGGVRVFEYQAAVLHAKTLVADDLVSVAGSTNLDYRSLRLNAECNLVMLCPVTNATLAAAFEADVAGSTEIHLVGWKHRPFLQRLGDFLARCLAPVL
jgi:cardiolipin synthase A/B